MLYAVARMERISSLRSAAAEDGVGIEHVCADAEFALQPRSAQLPLAALLTVRAKSCSARSRSSRR